MTRVGKLALGILLLVGLMTGVILQPDDGTTVQRPDGAGVVVDGANHAKPLPRTSTATDIVIVLAVVVVALALVRVSATFLGRREPSRTMRRQLLAARVVVPRGPPAAV